MRRRCQAFQHATQQPQPQPQLAASPHPESPTPARAQVRRYTDSAFASSLAPGLWRWGFMCLHALATVGRFCGTIAPAAAFIWSCCISSVSVSNICAIDSTIGSVRRSTTNGDGGSGTLCSAFSSTHP